MTQTQERKQFPPAAAFLPKQYNQNLTSQSSAQASSRGGWQLASLAKSWFSANPHLWPL